MNIAGLFLVGTVWGITNPFLEKGVKDKEQDIFGFKLFLKTILNFSFIIPFGINQLGSILYYYLLGHTPLSIAPILVNCVNSSVTLITESWLKNKKITLKKMNGLLLIIIGTYLIL